jgi:hypothetical protein
MGHSTAISKKVQDRVLLCLGAGTAAYKKSWSILLPKRSANDLLGGGDVVWRACAFPAAKLIGRQLKALERERNDGNGRHG